MRSWDPKQHPRDTTGQFSTSSRADSRAVDDAIRRAATHRRESRNPSRGISGTKARGIQIGRVLGSPNDRVYTKTGEDPGARFRPADSDFRFIEDPDDRTTALLQYSYDGRRVVEHVAANLRAGRDPFDGVDTVGADERRRWLEYNSRSPHPKKFGPYDEDDLEKDLHAAAVRLTEWLDNPQPIPIAYKGLRLPGTPEDLLRKYRPGHKERFTTSSFTSAVNVAMFYATSPDGDYRPTDGVPGLFALRNAQAVPLNSVGRTSRSEEVIVDGVAHVTSAGYVRGKLRVEWAWTGK